MKCNKCLNGMCKILAYASMTIMSLSCRESLPTYVPPQHVLSMSVSSIQQLNDHIAPPGHQEVQIVLSGENTYSEVIQDTVDFKGTMVIWWQRKPDRSKTFYLSEKNLSDPSLVHNRQMLLIPGQQFSMNLVWDLRSDNGVYLPSEMDFANLRQRYCDPNVRCANPEIFVVEVSLNVYDRLGYISAPATQFTFIGRECDVGGYPPCN